MKYKVKYVGKIVWFKEVDVKNDANPYPEIDAVELDLKDGFVDIDDTQAEKVTRITSPAYKQ